jgi:hypothetical protein
MKTLSWTRIVAGLLVILVGAGLLLNNLHITPFVDLAKNWWPLIVIVIGILIFIHDMKNYLWALLVVAVGIVWQLNARQKVFRRRSVMILQRYSVGRSRITTRTILRRVKLLRLWVGRRWIFAKL